MGCAEHVFGGGIGLGSRQASSWRTVSKAVSSLPRALVLSWPTDSPMASWVDKGMHGTDPEMPLEGDQRGSQLQRRMSSLSMSGQVTLASLTFSRLGFMMGYASTGFAIANSLLYHEDD